MTRGDGTPRVWERRAHGETTFGRTSRGGSADSADVEGAVGERRDGVRLSVVTVTVRLSAPTWVPIVPTSVPGRWVAVTAQR